MRSRKIAHEIMSEMHKEVKSFLADTISHRRTKNFGEIEEAVSELSAKFSKLVTQGAMEAIGNGHVGPTIECKCGGAKAHKPHLTGWNSSWIG